MESNGYLLMKNFFTKKEAADIRKWASNMSEIKEEKGKWMIYYEQSQLRSRIENFCKYNPEINNFVNTKIKKFLELIVGEKVSLFKDKMNWKYPKGKGFLAHQDHPAWSDFPPSIYYTAAIFGDDSTIENGCLQFVCLEQKIKNEIIDYDKDGSGKILDEEKMDWENIETTPRDLLIFNSFIPHRSGENMSDKSRRIFYFTFNLSKEGDFFEEYLKKKREEFPPPNERNPDKEYKVEGTKYNLANPII